VYEIEMQEMTLCYKMLLLVEMAELADAHGQVPLRTLAERFQTFFMNRKIQGKTEENPNRFKNGLPSERSITALQRIIREQPVRYLTKEFVVKRATWCAGRRASGHNGRRHSKSSFAQPLLIGWCGTSLPMCLEGFETIENYGVSLSSSVRLASGC
jgi:hypothetical protein